MMKPIKNKVTVRLLLGTMLTLSLTTTLWPFASKGSAAVTLTWKTESQLKSEAGLYDTAIREISQIANLKLATPDDAKIAQEILDKHVRNLKFGHSKFVVLGLSDSTFINAAKARTADKQSAEQFGQQLVQDPESVYKLDGASALRDRIKSAAAADRAKLDKVAGLLTQSAAEIKSSAHHAVAFATKLNVPPLTVNAGSETEQTTATVIAVMIIRLPTISTYSGFGIGASNSLGELLTDLFGDFPQSRVSGCQTLADSKYADCLSRIRVSFPFSLAAANECRAAWVNDGKVCLFGY